MWIPPQNRNVLAWAATICPLCLLACARQHAAGVAGGEWLHHAVPRWVWFFLTLLLLKK